MKKLSEFYAAHRTLSYWVVTVLVVVLVFLVVDVFFAQRKDESHNEGDIQQTPDTALTPTAYYTGTPHIRLANGPTPSMESYTDAVAHYAKSRIQFNASCGVFPLAPIVFKNGTVVMLDNRSEHTRTIGIDGKTPYEIEPYGYALLNLSYETVPQTINLDCDSNQNVVTIVVER